MSKRCQEFGQSLQDETNMAKKSVKETTSFPALKVSQWLKEWESVEYDDSVFQSEPPHFFYLFSLKASTLKALTGVYRRSARKGSARAKDPNVQRGHEEKRSETIREFVQYGFPWCEMSHASREKPDSATLKKPGWLPTSIIVNVLTQGEKRNGQSIGATDLVKIDEKGAFPQIHFPKSYTHSKWEPETIYPLEVIDGQHRLWAFEEFEPDGDFELPVVAFHGLDRSWQAYLFWSVNITPKRINRSLAFDLYPLLRREDWLKKFTGHSIYRETRCQELVEALWSHPDSPWCERINMLGETSQQRGSDSPMVSQASWIRSLMATFVKEWKENSSKIGGLFGAARNEDEITLPWTRPMQAAFLIFAGQLLQRSVKESKEEWSSNLRAIDGHTLFEEDDPAFYGKYSLLMTDQGTRVFLYVLNDLCYQHHAELELSDWHWEVVSASPSKKKSLPATDQDEVSIAIRSLSKTRSADFLRKLAVALSKFDWRTSSTPKLERALQQRKAAYRGSGGYKELRIALLEHLESEKGEVGQVAGEVLTGLGY